jgi:phospholipase/lecithinase/hemolysin
MMALGAALLCGAVATAMAAGNPTSAPFSGLVVFGDSLSDTGNAGRFSNGPVWVEVIAERIGVELKPSRAGGSNYAVGGARTHGGVSDVRGQLASYLSARKRGAEMGALHIVSGGANDLLAAGCEPNRDAVSRSAAESLAASVDDLVAAGVRRILVPNLPDIGYAPVVRALGPACVAAARRLTETFNAALERRLRIIEEKRSVHVQRLDVFSLADEVMRDPRSAGFENVTMPCQGGPCGGALFWDYLHPTSAAHARLAAEALRAIGITHDVPSDRARGRAL